MNGEHEAWRGRWRSNQIGFHQAGPTPLLVRFIDEVVKSASQRVLVPLCGKTKDLSFLAERGHAVVGVELVEDAVTAFFSEAELAPTRRTVAGGVAYEDGPLRLYAADFFALGDEELGRFELIFDRAALVALPPALRARYAARELELLVPGGEIFLVTCDYDQTEMNGPPFSVPESVVRSLYAGARVEHLSTEDALEDRFRARGVHAMTESAWRIKKT